MKYVYVVIVTVNIEHDGKTVPESVCCVFDKQPCTDEVRAAVSKSNTVANLPYAEKFLAYVDWGLSTWGVPRIQNPGVPMAVMLVTRVSADWDLYGVVHSPSPMTTTRTVGGIQVERRELQELS